MMSDRFTEVRIDNCPPFFLSFGGKTDQYFRDSESNPDYEPWTTQVFLKMLSESPKFLDIGANVGWYSCIASAISDDRALTYAFEPEPANFSLLNSNINKNGFRNVRTRSVALGSLDGEGQLYLSAENAGDHRLASAEEGRTVIDIEIARLDTVLRGSDFVPDLVKIDVQGAEPLVFAGGEQTFNSAGEGMAMFIEFQPESLGLEQAHKLADRLFAFNRPVFDLYPYDGGMLRPIAQSVLHEAIEGCLHPRFPAHIDILIAPLDGRLERVSNLIGSPFEQWNYE